jgi:alpha-beta hydrolase superfamily lysophospholipase
MDMVVREESFAIAAHDGVAIPVHRWQKHFGARAIVVISHGLAEHALRYRPVAMLLADKDYAVYANDHRGHGFAVTRSDLLGEFGEGGFAALVEDMKQVIFLAATEHPGAPIFLLGHSMGSYTAQFYILENSANLAGVALTGGSAMDLRCRGLVSDGLMSMVEDNRQVRTTPPDFDWLSRDRAVVASYLDDPLCGFAPSSATLKRLFVIAPQLRDSNQLHGIRKDLPLYMFTGELDPINGFVRYFTALLERYQFVGLRNVSARVYRDGARHEMLNELNRAEVVDDLVRWIEATRAERSTRQSAQGMLAQTRRRQKTPLPQLHA